MVNAAANAGTFSRKVQFSKNKRTKEKSTKNWAINYQMRIRFLFTSGCLQCSQIIFVFLPSHRVERGLKKGINKSPGNDYAVWIIKVFFSLDDLSFKSEKISRKIFSSNRTKKKSFSLSTERGKLKVLIESWNENFSFERNFNKTSGLINWLKNKLSSVHLSSASITFELLLRLRFGTRLN